MKKSIITLCLLMVLVMVFTSIAMADDKVENRAGKIIIKAGIMIPTNKVTVAGQPDPLVGAVNFTVEGEYVVYSTDYVDFSGVFGYYRTSINNPVPLSSNYNMDSLNSIYYMGGVKIYPTKKGFYICGYAGGGTTFVKGTLLSLGVPTTVDNSFSSFAFKAGAGYDINENLVVEATYLVQDNEDLESLLNSNGVIRYEDNGGVQIMGGYKF